jgi:hypothetical protein
VHIPALAGSAAIAMPAGITFACMHPSALSGFSHRQYTMAALTLLLIEVAIALFVHDDWVRPYLGDVLVVILMYATLRALQPHGAWRRVAVGVLLVALVVEGLQYLRLLHWLGWQQQPLLRVVLGTYFAWADVWCYLAGIALVAAAERWKRKGWS